MECCGRIKSPDLDAPAIIPVTDGKNMPKSSKKELPLIVPCESGLS
jgi:hypothetical protein